MRPLELLVLATAATALLIWLVGRGRSAERILLGVAYLAVIAAIVEATLEGSRWQLLPAYVLIGFLAVASLAKMLRGAATVRQSWLRWTGRRLGDGIAILVLAAAVALPALFPVIIMPTPSGPHAVGIVSFTLRDDARAETFAAAGADRRELRVLAWYPAGASEDKPAPFWFEPEIVGPELARALGMPNFLFDHLRLAPSHARRNVRAVGGQAFPVVVFNHGYAQGFAGQNSALAEELASRGYVVLSIDHPYECLIATLSAGRIVTANKEQIRRLLSEFGGVHNVIAKIPAADPTTAEALYRQVLSNTPVTHASHDIWVADTRFVLDRLGDIQSGAIATPLAGTLDSSRLGLFGMSFGASVAVDVCAFDPRCDAAVNLDGFQLGRAIDGPMAKPALFLASPQAGAINLPVFRRLAGDALYVVVPGSTHLDFSDFPLISPLFRWMGALGPVGGERMHATLADYVGGFFDRYVKGGAAPDLEALGTGHPYALRLIKRAGEAGDLAKRARSTNENR